MATSPRGPDLLSSYLSAGGLAQTDLAVKLDVHQSTLSRWASGKQNPDIDGALKLRDFCGIPVEAWAINYTPLASSSASSEAA